MLKPPCELGPLAIEIELFDSMKSSSSIFITSNVYGIKRLTPYGRAIDISTMVHFASLQGNP